MSIQYDKPFINRSGEEIPAYALMELHEGDGIHRDSVDDSELVKVVKPGTQAPTGLYLINGPASVDKGQRGQGTRSWPARVLYDDDIKPRPGERWGPVGDEWHIARGKGNFSVVGGIDESERTVRVELGARVSASIAGAIGILTDTMEPMEVEAGGASDQSLWKIKPGLSSSVLLLDWEKESPTGQEYIDSNYKRVFRHLTPVWEDIGYGPELAFRLGFNVSESLFRADHDEPIIVVGTQSIIEVEGFTTRIFNVANNYDLRSMQGYLKGTAPTIDDDPGLQIPFHSGGSGAFQLNSGSCND